MVIKNKQFRREIREKRTRAKIFGTASRPRLSVFRSLKHLFVQLIDDQKDVTLVSAKDSELKKEKINKTDVAFKVGELLATKAQKAGIAEIVFDKSSYLYHGRVKAIA